MAGEGSLSCHVGAPEANRRYTYLVSGLGGVLLNDL